MRKKIFLLPLIALVIIFLSGCTMPFGQPEGPDSGEEIDTSQEPSSPDSGEEVDHNEPTSPDSGEEIDTSEPTSPDSGEEIDTSGEPNSPDSGEEVDPNEPTSPDSGEEISLNDDLKNRARGSCNLISEGSTCVEYLGAMWTLSQAKLNCSPSSAFSAKPCPRPALGGCWIGAGMATEIVTWHYSYGGDPYTEVISYASAACRNLPGGQWVN